MTVRDRAFLARIFFGILVVLGIVVASPDARAGLATRAEAPVGPIEQIFENVYLLYPEDDQKIERIFPSGALPGVEPNLGAVAGALPSFEATFGNSELVLANRLLPGNEEGAGAAGDAFEWSRTEPREPEFLTGDGRYHTRSISEIQEESTRFPELTSLYLDLHSFERRGEADSGPTAAAAAVRQETAEIAEARSYLDELKQAHGDLTARLDLADIRKLRENTASRLQTPLGAGEGVPYLAERGEDLRSVARKFGVSIEALVALNHADSSRSRLKKVLVPRDKFERWRIAEQRARRSSGFDGPEDSDEEGGDEEDGDEEVALVPAPEPVPIVASAAGGKFSWPIQARRLSSRFGFRRHPVLGRRKFHNGIDLAAPYGSKIVAADSGRVVFAGWKPYFGKTVIVQHANGLRTLYAHCSRTLVRPGQSVRRNERIALCGQSGMATGPHLHFSVEGSRGWVNPLNYMKM